MKKNRTIFVIISDSQFSFSNLNSAVANYLLSLKDNLEKDGFQVKTFPSSERKGAFTESKMQPVRFQVLKKLFKALLPSIYNDLIIRSKIKASEKLLREIRCNEAPDLIIEFLTAGSKTGFELKKIWKKPLLIIMDSPLREQFQDMYGRAFTAGKKIDDFERLSIESADSIICYSETMSRFVSEKYKISGKVNVFPCIIYKNQSDQFNTEDKVNKSPLIGFIGSFLSWHKVELLVSAFKEIHVKFPDVRLVLIGYGVEWERIKKQVHDFGMNDCVEMPGFVNEQMLNEYKKKLTIGVMPGSNWYGSPLKLFEYAQSSIAIIAPETPVVKELFTKEEALFIDDNNSLQSLVQNMRLLLTDNALRMSLISNAYKKMQGSYSRESQGRIFSQIVMKTIENGIKK
ncbi:MAG: glycosyltransferase [Crocinitomicaceae bacterium]|nr:glycosyltransferase [Crocinitomicaceae bacterium]